MNILYRLGVLLLLISSATSCNRQYSTDTTKHYSDEILEKFKKISGEQKNRDTGFYLIDSLYKTFHYISAADKYRYYDFKRELFEIIRYSDRSYDTAITYVDSMINVIEDNHLEREMSKDYIQSFNIRSEYYSRLYRYNEAIRDISRCKQLNEKAGDSCMMAENTRTLSLIAIRQSDFSLATSLLKEALQLAKTCKDNWDQFVRLQRYLDDLGYFYSEAKKFDSSLIYHFAAANYVEQNKDRFIIDTLFPYIALQNIYANIAVSSEQLNKFSQAQEYISKAMHIQKNITKDSVEFARTQLILARILFNRGHIEEAAQLADISLGKMNTLDLFFKLDLFNLKVKISKVKQQYKEEAIYQERTRLVNDSISKIRIDLLKKNPLTEYERIDKKYQIELLEKDNRIQQNKTNAAIVIGALLTLLAIISLYLIWRLRIVMKKRSLVYKKLVASEKELKETMLQKEIAEKQLRETELVAQEMQLQMKFNEAIIEQRSQISDDMHDELSSSLAALKFYVEDEKNKSVGTMAERSLTNISAEVNTMYKHARSYMHSLKTNNWESRVSLVDFLKEIQYKFSEKSLMIVDLHIEEEKIKSVLTHSQQDQLYHICSEAITNIIKHARASLLAIQIYFYEEHCHFSISDNGIGFSSNEYDGLGLASIKKRALILNGDLKISTGNSGTTIKGSFPIK